VIRCSAATATESQHAEQAQGPGDSERQVRRRSRLATTAPAFNDNGIVSGCGLTYANIRTVRFAIFPERAFRRRVTSTSGHAFAIDANLAKDALSVVGTRWNYVDIVAWVERVFLSLVDHAIMVRIFQTIGKTSRIGVIVDWIRGRNPTVHIDYAISSVDIGSGPTAIKAHFGSVEELVVVTVRIEDIDLSIIVRIFVPIDFHSVAYAIIVRVSVVGVGTNLRFDVVQNSVAIRIRTIVVELPVAIAVDQVPANFGNGNSGDGAAVGDSSHITIDLSCRGTRTYADRTCRADCETIVHQAIAIVIEAIAGFRGHAGQTHRRALDFPAIARRISFGTHADISSHARISRSGRSIIGNSITIIIEPIAYFELRYRV